MSLKPVFIYLKINYLSFSDNPQAIKYDPTIALIIAISATAPYEKVISVSSSY